VAIDALFQLHFLQQIIDGQRHRRFYFAIDHHAPWANGQSLRSSIDLFRRAELVIVVEGLVEILSCDGRPASENVGLSLAG
jgi:hypothetical protein